MTPKRSPKRVVVNDLMQRNYRYKRTEPPGRNFQPGFRPQLTLRQMLRLGVFGGKYMTDCRREFPAAWFERAKLCHERHGASLNYFKVNASKPLCVVLACTSGMDSTVDAMKSRDAFESSTIRILNPIRSRPFAWVKALQESSRSYQIPAQSLSRRPDAQMQ